jgi:protoporphyrinogen oxidase
VVEADAVVLAVDGPAAKALAGVDIPEGQVGCTTLYFGGDESLYRGRKILLNANPDAFVTDCGMISNVAPAYAPPGKHLLSVSVLGARDMPDEQLAARALDDLARMAPEERLRTYRLLWVYRIPYAQFAQPPGFRARLPRELNPEPGLWLAGEYFRTSSINGAMASGEAAARALLSQA